MSDTELKPISKEPPPPVQRKGTTRGSKYDPIIEELKKNPGVKYKVLEDVTTSTARVFVDRGCEYTTRKSEVTDRPNRVDIWAWCPVDSSQEPKAEDAAKPKPKAEVTTKPVAKKAATKKAVAKKASAKRPAARK